MKTSLTLMAALVLSIVTANAAAPVTEQSTWTETYIVQTASPQLVIKNIWGGVKVRTGEEGRISVSATELRSAPDQERFERSLETMTLDVQSDVNGVTFIVGNPDERWHRMNRCDGCRLDIQFEVLVPSGTIVDVGTVMDGRIDIEGVTGIVTARNVNGPIKVDDIQDCEAIESVNGRVHVGFSRSPARDCNIETINGDITLDIPVGTGLDVTLDLFNGKVVSEFVAGPLDLPATIEHTTENGHNQYRIQKLSGLRIGAGGPIYSIASINGDVRIQKHQ